MLVTDMDWHITFYKEADAGKKDQVYYMITMNTEDNIASYLTITGWSKTGMDWVHMGQASFS